jgi:hypothetical protein
MRQLPVAGRLRLADQLRVVCVDLDSTLADTRHRRELCPTVNPASTWDDYTEACGGDVPLAGAVTLVRLLAASGYGIHVVTNRSHRFREQTVSWLRTHGIPANHVALRPPDVVLDDTDRWKLDYLRIARASGYTVLLFVEDWPATADAIEAVGIPVLCVNPRYASTPVPV